MKNLIKKTLFLLTLSLSSILVAQDIGLRSGSAENLIDISTIELTFSYEHMSIKGFDSEEDFINAYTDSLNKKKPGKGDRWKKKWTTERRPYYHAIFEKVFRSELSKDYITIGQKMKDSDYILKISILNCEYGKFSGNYSHDVIYTYKFELFDIKKRKLILESEKFRTVGEFANGIGITPMAGVRTPNPWDNYTIDAKTRQAYSIAARATANFFRHHLKKKLNFKPILLLKYNIGSHFDYLTPSFQIAAEYMFPSSFSTQLELGYITNSALINYIDIGTKEDGVLSGFRLRNEYRAYVSENGNFGLYFAFDYLYKNYKVKDDIDVTIDNQDEVWNLTRKKQTHAGHFKLGYQNYIADKVSIDVYIGFGIRHTKEKHVNPYQVSSLDVRFPKDKHSNKTLLSGVFGIKVGYILIKR